MGRKRGNVQGRVRQEISDDVDRPAAGRDGTDVDRGEISGSIEVRRGILGHDGFHGDGFFDPMRCYGNWQ